jgi:uncharacterized protein YqhQ
VYFEELGIIGFIIGVFVLIEVWLALLPTIAANLSQVESLHLIGEFLQALLRLIGLS